jgi:hypothetical protein
LILNNSSYLFKINEIEHNKFFIHRYELNEVEISHLERIYVIYPYIVDISGKKLIDYPLTTIPYT